MNAALMTSAEKSVAEETVSKAVFDNLKSLHEKEVGQLKERLIRCHADMDNLRKRTSKEREEIVKFANETLISNMLPILDNFEHAWKASEQSEDFESFRKGIQMIYQQLMSVLTDSGLEKIQAKGEQFDPRFHHAVATDWKEDIDENRVIDVMREGFLYQGRVIRPAMVRVNKKPEKSEGVSMKPNPNIQPEPLSEMETTVSEEAEIDEINGEGESSEEKE